MLWTLLSTAGMFLVLLGLMMYSELRGRKNREQEQQLCDDVADVAAIAEKQYVKKFGSIPPSVKASLAPKTDPKR